MIVSYESKCCFTNSNDMVVTVNDYFKILGGQVQWLSG